MATLACVYGAEPAPRRPHDVIAPPGGRHGSRTAILGAFIPARAAARLTIATVLHNE